MHSRQPSEVTLLPVILVLSRTAGLSDYLGGVGGTAAVFVSMRVVPVTPMWETISLAVFLLMAVTMCFRIGYKDLF